MKGLLLPSVIQAAAGHVAAGATVNGIPALASYRGRLSEAVGDGGACLSGGADDFIGPAAIRTGDAAVA